jgi:hypothetical protein
MAHWIRGAAWCRTSLAGAAAATAAATGTGTFAQRLPEKTTADVKGHGRDNQEDNAFFDHGFSFDGLAKRIFKCKGAKTQTFNPFISKCYRRVLAPLRYGFKSLVLPWLELKSELAGDQVGVVAGATLGRGWEPVIRAGGEAAGPDRSAAGEKRNHSRNKAPRFDPSPIQ